LEDVSTPKIMHNAKFDLSWMIEHCPSPNGQMYARNIQDTMLKSQLVHDYRTKSGAAKAGRPQHWAPNDLQSVLQEQLGVEISKSIDHETTDWTGVWSMEMLDYMLEDIEYLAPLNQALDKKLQQQGQERASWIEQSAVFATAWMGVNGIKPDVSSWHASIEDWKEQHHEALMDLLTLWPGVENYGSPKQLVESSARVLGGRLVNTKKATLKQMSAGFPAVAKLLEQRHLATRLKNWGPHYLEAYVCRICSRFHPGWNQIGTETSRPSCWKPNLLQIPRAAEFRALFVAEEGHQIVSLDYSAIEVLVAGVFANEPRLIEACSTGDPHLATAMLISGDKDMVKSDPRRQAAKIANFGLLFGGGAQGLVTQALDLFDTVLTLGEATVMMDQYFRLYPGLKRTKGWAYDQLQAYRRNQGWSQMELARQLGYGRSTVAHWEQGLRYPTRRSMQRLDAVFGFLPAWEARYPPICPLCQIARTDWSKRDCGSCRGKRYRARKRMESVSA
jgi:DNA polymerase I-like protein with 3'-5' exonuclease and polymerase domains